MILFGLMDWLLLCLQVRELWFGGQFSGNSRNVSWVDGRGASFALPFEAGEPDRARNEDCLIFSLRDQRDQLQGEYSDDR